MIAQSTLNHPTPEHALLASGQGDEQAFGVLYEVMAARVYGLALKLVRDPHQAEEVAQEVFLQVWQRADSYDAERGSALAWVMTLTHRRAVDRVRSAQSARHRDQAHANDHAGERDVWSAFDPTAAGAQARFDAARVHAALGDLSQEQRQAVHLAYFGGHTHLEISRLTQVPLGTAKYRIRQGLSRLRDSLSILVAEPA